MGTNSPSSADLHDTNISDRRFPKQHRMHWTALLLAVAANAIANIAFKEAIQRHAIDKSPRGLLQLLFEPWLWIGGAFAGLLLVCYLYALKGIALNVAYPAVTGLAMLGVAIGSVVVFGETLSLQRGFAMLLILAGVVLLKAST